MIIRYPAASTAISVSPGLCSNVPPPVRWNSCRAEASLGASFLARLKEAPSKVLQNIVGGLGESGRGSLRPL